jgi:hypothetical protein
MTTASGFIYSALPKKPNQLYLEFKNDGKIPERKKDTNYQVWKTDYTSYSLVYLCTMYGFIKYEDAWILSRDKQLDEAVISDLKLELAKHKVNVKELKKVSQNC